MERRNAIKRMVAGIAVLLGLKSAQAFEPKCRKTAHGEVYWVEFSPEQYEEVHTLIKSISSDLYANKLKSYKATYSHERICVIEWSPNTYV